MCKYANEIQSLPPINRQAFSRLPFHVSRFTTNAMFLNTKEDYTFD